MKLQGPLSAACVAAALSPTTTEAFSPSVSAVRRNNNHRIRNFPANFQNSCPPVGVVPRPITALDAATMGTATGAEPHSPAQRRAAAEMASMAKYRRSNYSPAAWADFTRSDPLMSSVRTELISKFVQLGRSAADAEAEVDAFLDDEERSGEFVEMRRYAAVHKEDSMGFEDALLYLGAFCAGAAVDVALRLAAEHLDVSVPFFS